jgi:very-short-patch-repair endonuclease
MLTGPGATIGKARNLRREMSLPEVLLWRELRKRPGGLKFRRQHPAGPYILDFACLECRLAIEIDGETHGRGGAAVHDEVRDEWLANQGYRTLRIPARDVLGNLDGVVRMLAIRPNPEQPLHQPSAGPPPRTGEDLC